VSKDAPRIRPGRKIVFHERGQFAGDVAVHPVVCAPRPRGSVYVETRAGAEVVVVVFAGEAEAARARVGGDEHDAVLGREPLRPPFVMNVSSVEVRPAR
jgi:hypothetical protein